MNLASPVFTRDRRQIRDALMRLRLPSIGSNALQAEAGYLVSLGSNMPRVAKRVADIGVRLLAGTRASAIPVEQVDDFELVDQQRHRAGARREDSATRCARGPCAVIE